MSKGRRIQITQIHPRDGFYVSRDRFVGQTGMFEPDLDRFQLYRGYFKGRFYRDGHQGPDDYVYFLGVRYKKVEEEGE